MSFRGATVITNILQINYLSQIGSLEDIRFSIQHWRGSSCLMCSSHVFFDILRLIHICLSSFLSSNNLLRNSTHSKITLFMSLFNQLVFGFILIICLHLLRHSGASAGALAAHGTSDYLSTFLQTPFGISSFSHTITTKREFQASTTHKQRGSCQMLAGVANNWTDAGPFQGNTSQFQPNFGQTGKAWAKSPGQWVRNAWKSRLTIWPERNSGEQRGFVVGRNSAPSLF